MKKQNLPQFLNPLALIDGEWCSSPQNFPVLNPANGEEICAVPDVTRDQTLKAIDAAYKAQREWKKLLVSERAEILMRWRDLILAHKKELAELLTLEQGKPIAEALSEISVAENISWAVEESFRIYGHTIPPFKRGLKAEIQYEPVGVVVAVTPWNFPHSMITRKVAPALAAGCAVVLKPSEDTPLCALALGALAIQAGLPQGVLNILTVSRNNVQTIGEILATHKFVRKISFTGSTRVGKILMAHAAGTVKNISLELGGNAPFIICESANLEKAIDALIGAKFRNAGQTCISANRVFVHENIFEKVRTLLMNKLNAFKIGAGSDENNNLACLINEAAKHKYEELLADAKVKGAILEEAKIEIPSCGYFAKPVIVSNITKEMRLSREEAFAPIISLFSFKNTEDVTERANDTEYGLAAYIHSADLAEARHIANQLEFGMVTINEPSIVHPTLPFGGMKESGIGREGGAGALKEFLEVKTIVTGI